MKLNFGFLTKEEKSLANAILTERKRKKYDGKILLKDTGKKPHAYELSGKHKSLLRRVLNRAWARMQNA